MDPNRTPTGSARRFRLQRCIGKGGFGEVYLAEMSTSSGFVKTVAVKVLREDVQGHEQVASRLRDEARLLGLLRHPAIVRADDLITLAGRPAVVMEYVPGVNLSWLINPKRCPERMPPRVALSILRQVAAALDAAYARPSPGSDQPLRVLHRDIKPGNIRITVDGEVKVLDFGIARSEHAGREADTKNYQLGSLRYMAPEMMSGMHASHQSDVYALGVVCFETLARKRLGWAGDSPEAHRNQVQGRIEEADLTAFPGETWNRVVALLERMLAYDPAERPSARQVVETCRELEAALEGPSLELWAHDVLPRVEVPEEPKDADLSGQTLFEDATSGTPLDPPEIELDEATEPTARPARRRPSWPLGLAAGLLALGMVGGSLWIALDRGAPGSRDAAESAAPATAPAPSPSPAPAAVPAPPPAAPPDPAPLRVAQPEPAARPTARERSPNAAPGPAPAVAPAAAAPQPTPEPAAPPAAAAPVKVRFGSVPFGLMVYVDGALAGKTPRTLEVAPGAHSLMFVDGERTQRVEIEVVPGGKSIWTYNSSRGDVQ